MDTKTNQERVEKAIKEAYKAMRESDSRTLLNLFYKQCDERIIDNTIEALNKLKTQK